MTAKAEELEQFVALGATNVFLDMPLGGLEGMDAFKVLSPRMAVKGVVSLPWLSELIRKGIATTIDAVDIMIVLGTLDKVAIPVGSSRKVRVKSEE